MKESDLVPVTLPQPTDHGRPGIVPGVGCDALEVLEGLLLNAVRVPHENVVDLRGTVDTRGRKGHAGELDAVVLAAAGVHRLGRRDVIVEYLDFLPAPAQGALAVQACADRDDVLAALRPLHDEETARCTRAERELLAVLEGGCSVPVGALATVAGATLTLRGIVAAPDGSRALEAESSGEDPEALGREVATHLRAQGAEEILNA